MAVMVVAWPEYAVGSGGARVLCDSFASAARHFAISASQKATCWEISARPSGVKLSWRQVSRDQTALLRRFDPGHYVGFDLLRYQMSRPTAKTTSNMMPSG